MPGKRKLRSKLRLVLFTVLLLCLFGGGFALANNLIWPMLTGGNLVDTGNIIGQQDLTTLPGINVLMLGVDERQNDVSLRTDTMILANINNKDNRISLLSIPRDTKVYLPGHGYNKINDANYFGGPEETMRVVSDLTGVKVDYYVLTNFNGFKDIVDALGGVTIDVETNMQHSDPESGGKYAINLQKGVQRLNGTQALMYARYRGYALGDISRTQNQLKLLTAIGDEVMQPSSIGKLPKLVPSIYKNVETNMGLTQMLAMAKAAKNLDNLQMVTQTLPGYFLDEQGISYWYVDPQDAKTVTLALFEEGKVVDVVEGAMGDGSVSGGKTQVAAKPSAPAEQSAAKQSAAGSSPNDSTAAPETDDAAGDAAGGTDAANAPDAASASDAANSSADGLPADGDTVAGTTGTAPNPGQDAANGDNANSSQDSSAGSPGAEVPAQPAAKSPAPPSAAPPSAAQPVVTPAPEQQQEHVTITVNN